MNKKYLITITALIGFILLITIGNMAYPNATRVVLNIFWFFLLSVTVIFISLGILAILGLKKEVSKLLEMIMEGSFSVIDLMRSIREFIHLFVEEIKAALISLAPLFSYLFALCAYLLLIYLYKLVGVHHDVTLMTVLLTISMIGLVALLNFQNPKVLDSMAWRSRFQKRIKDSFADALEVVIFIFFLTMDSTRLFFVPPELNVPIEAEVFGYDLMVRAFHLADNRITLTIIIIAIVSEIIRNILRVFFLARKYSRETYDFEMEAHNPEQARYQRIKNAIRQSFNESRDDIIKFISFTTLLVLVFLLFPRLKILSMAVASLTALLLDLLIPARLVITKSNDLISRILNRVFNL